MFSYLDVRDKTAVLTRRMKYFTNNGKQTQHFSFYFANSFIFLVSGTRVTRVNHLIASFFGLRPHSLHFHVGGFSFSF